MDHQTEIELQAAAFRRLQKHLMQDRTDVQNIDLMNMAGFCRNCLSRWYQEAAAEKGIEMTKDGFSFLCMGFTGKKAAKFKEDYIEEFNRMADSLNSISARVNRLEVEGREIKQLGREWSELGREVRKAKDDHRSAADKLMSEVQLKLDY